LHYHFYNRIWPIVLLRNRPVVSARPGAWSRGIWAEVEGEYNAVVYISRDLGQGRRVAAAEVEW